MFENSEASWVKLDDALSLGCRDWAVRSDEIALSDLKVIRQASGSAVGLLARVVKRNGSRIYRYHPLAGQGHDAPDEGRDFVVGPAATIAGPSFSGEPDQLALLLRLDGGDSKLEIRDTRSNSVQGESGRLGPAHQAESKAGAHGIWALLEGENYWPSYVRKSKGSGALQVTLYPGFEKDEKPILIPAQDSAMRDIASYIFTESADSMGASQRDRFKVVRLDSQNQSSSTRTLNLTVESGIETWSVLGNPKATWLAYVDGDSIVGQASLRIAKLQLDGPGEPVLSETSVPLGGAHAAQPIWVGQGGKVYLLQLKWLEGDGVLSIYPVSNRSPEDLTSGKVRDFSGFARGTDLSDAYFTDEGKQLRLIKRSKAGMNLKFEICSIDTEDWP